MKNPIRILFDILTPDRGIIASVLTGLTVSIVPAVFISSVVYFIFRIDETPLPKDDLVVSFIEIGLLAPFLETVMMWPLLIGIMKITRQNKVMAALISAALWAVFHGAFSPTWALTIIWPFLIFSIIFLNWRPKGLVYAIGVTATVHALQNNLAILYIHFG